jgi:cytoskeletal protein RodZ
MKKQKKMKMKIESRSLLIVISAAFIVALGFIYWQNFIYKQDTPISSDGFPASSSNSTSQKQTRYLTLDNWGIRIPLTDSSYYYKSGDYTTISATDQKYEISTKSLRVACGTDKASIGTIERVPASENNDTKIGASDVKGTRVFGKYLYILTAPHSTCGDSAEILRLQGNATKELIPLLGSIEEA